MLNVRISLVLVLAILQLATSAYACPFCSAVSQTFSEEIKMMDVVALTKLKSRARTEAIDLTDPQEEVPKSVFEITKVIKGHDYIKVGDTFETIYFGEAKKDRAFLAMGTDAPNVVWSSPLILTDRAKTYLTKLGDVPKGRERLAFFQDFLEDEDEMLARDAYDEFAKAPYADVIALKPKMKRAKLLEFIKNPDVPSNRRRLYFTMLGVCGNQADAKLLEEFMTADNRKSKSGLDAMLACYVILSGEKGLDKVDELFLKNRDAEYADTYAAIMAIRFHGSETDVVPRKRLVQSLRHMLDRPELADLVIPDLARWEDWDVISKLCDLFIKADENSSWVRVPVVNYLRACPLPLAKEKIEQLKLVDAESVKRAMMFFPLSSDKEKDEKASEDASEGEGEEKKDVSADVSETHRQEQEGDLVAEVVATEDAGDSPVTPLPEHIVEQDVVEQDGVVQSVVDDSTGQSVVGKAAAGKASTVAQATASTKSTTLKEARALATSTTSINTPATLSQVEQLIDDDKTNRWFLMSVATIAGGVCFVLMRSVMGVGLR